MFKIPVSHLSSTTRQDKSYPTNIRADKWQAQTISTIQSTHTHDDTTSGSHFCVTFVDPPIPRKVLLCSPSSPSPMLDSHRFKTATHDDTSIVSQSRPLHPRTTSPCLHIHIQRHTSTVPGSTFTFIFDRHRRHSMLYSCPVGPGRLRSSESSPAAISKKNQMPTLLFDVTYATMRCRRA